METDCGQWKTKGKAHEKRLVWSHSTHIRYEQHATTLVLEKKWETSGKTRGWCLYRSFHPSTLPKSHIKFNRKPLVVRAAVLNKTRRCGVFCGRAQRRLPKIKGSVRGSLGCVKPQPKLLEPETSATCKICYPVVRGECLEAMVIFSYFAWEPRSCQLGFPTTWKRFKMF